MVIRGASRGNGKQLANYMLTMAENDNIRIVEVAGGLLAGEGDVRRELHSMSLTGELSRGDKGLFHAQINPAYVDDAKMTTEDWLEAADILGEELGLDGQRRVIVLHEKKGRTHAHVAWERYDLEKKKLVSDSFSRLAQDRARQRIEKELGHTRTPHRNVSRPEMKEALTSLWQRSLTGRDFITGAEKLGYKIGRGVQKKPFMVIDSNGRSFDLVKQVQGVGTRQVRERLGKEKLDGEKEIIARIRKAENRMNLDRSQEDMLDSIDLHKEKEAVKKEKKLFDAAMDFAMNKNDAMKEKRPDNSKKEKWEQDKINFVKAGSFDDNRDEILLKTETDPATEKERLKQEAIERMQAKMTQNKKAGHEPIG